MLREERDGATAILTLDYPERRNALAMPLRIALTEAMNRIESDPAVRAVVITGAGGVFSAGGDISGMDITDLASGRARFRKTHDLVKALMHSPKPIVAAVEGWCVGAGISLALCCDTIVSSAAAKFMTGFGKIGLMSDLGLPHLLPLRVGYGRAKQILLYGEQFDAGEALRIGLVDHVVAEGTALDEAKKRAALFAEMAPLPVALTKEYMARGLDDALALERDFQTSLFTSADHQEGKAAFLGKRKPKFTGV